MPIWLALPWFGLLLISCGTVPPSASDNQRVSASATAAPSDSVPAPDALKPADAATAVDLTATQTTLPIAADQRPLAAMLPATPKAEKTVSPAPPTPALLEPVDAEAPPPGSAVASLPSSNPASPVNEAAEPDLPSNAAAPASACQLSGSKPTEILVPALASALQNPALKRRGFETSAEFEIRAEKILADARRIVG